MESDYEFIQLLAHHYRRVDFGLNEQGEGFAPVDTDNLTSISDYCRFLQEQRTDEAWPGTSRPPLPIQAKFDEEQHLDFLRDHVLPELALKRRAQKWPQFNLWMAACATGEDAYIMAMLLTDILGINSTWPWWVEASDPDPLNVQKARVAIYRSEVLEKVPPAWIGLFLQKGFGPQEGNFRVKPEVQESVTFRTVDLLDGDPPYKEPFHVIYFRNILGTLSAEQQTTVLEKLWKTLVPGGYLLVGAKDIVNHSQPMETPRPATFRKPGPP